MSFTNLLTWSYWFTQPFTARGVAFTVLVVLFLFFVLLGLSAKIGRAYKSEKWLNEILRRIGNFGLTMGVLGLIWFFFRQERVTFLSWRFWLLFWIIGVIFWGYKIIWYAIVRVPKIKTESQNRVAQGKYLP
ncbi:MAG: hypothetical protein A3J93_01570 [Candidatus Magasanikbacteria bacterium RIFOXYC2_FULL_42_28]|uniref:Uncharacterized protein n=1 Tax=Candidatus Magasanikbacteria bacterium RIFOXYC2_FULL_42_28 TaxID=1798704 RepID=A0A1F6NXZ5_9BACT|nr:MAG: hypothetical protein A3J93_01570 [Candidatus Magasanikbacteria bacterium RIFOXYC2_FULL_42_28]